MTARLLLILSSLILCAPAQAQRRMIAEGLAASNNTVFIDTASIRFGVGLSTPSSRFHVHNGDVRISTSAGAASRGIIFQDGTTQATAASTPAVAQSSKTFNLTGTTTATTNFDICYASGTITASGTRPVQVYYAGSITQAGAAGRYCLISFMQDGAHIAPYSRTVGMGAAVTSSAGGFGNGSTSRVFPAPSAGSHSWCISMISPFGDACTFTYSSAHGNEFGVTEL